MREASGSTYSPFHELLSPYNPPRRCFLRWRTTPGGVSTYMRRNRQRVSLCDRSSSKRTPTEVTRSRNRKHLRAIVDFERKSSSTKSRLRILRKKLHWEKNYWEKKSWIKKIFLTQLYAAITELSGKYLLIQKDMYFCKMIYV